MNWEQLLWGAGGMVLLLGLAFALSTDRRAIRPRTVFGALAIQATFGVIVLYWDLGQRGLEMFTSGVQAVIDTSAEGIDFLFGPVLPEDGNVFAFQVLPVIVFFASLTAVLFHFGVLQWVTKIIGGGLQKALGTARAESMSATANIFVGQTEAPLVVRPYLSKMTVSQFFVVMTGGLATVAGSVLVGYALLGAPLEWLLAAAFMAAPGGLLMAKMVIPEALEPQAATADSAATVETGSDGTGTGGAPATSDDGVGSDAATGEASSDAADETAAAADETAAAADETAAAADGDDPAAAGDEARNVIDAAAAGASDGLRLALNVGAMLVAFISLIALLNLILGTAGDLFGIPDLTFELILGYVFSPVMFAIGVPWGEAVEAGSFLGQKIILNEFVAFQAFAPEIENFSERTAAIITFALTGFANFGSLAILLGGLGSLVPERRSLIAQYGLRAVFAATLANLMSATIAGMLIGTIPAS
jgi:concentrative nucleoside transporter, CNT family